MQKIERLQDQLVLAADEIIKQRQAVHEGIAILFGLRDDEICPPPPRTWWRTLFGFRSK